jgi:hypothetical protein
MNKFNDLTLIGRSVTLLQNANRAAMLNQLATATGYRPLTFPLLPGMA